MGEETFVVQCLLELVLTKFWYCSQIMHASEYGLLV